MNEWNLLETFPVTASENDMLRGMDALMYGREFGIAIGHIWKHPDGLIGARIAHLGGDAIRDWRATHWLPLPKPPTTSEKP